MRAIWKGAVTFGLVNVPVSVYSATESHDVRLHQVHDADGGRIRYQRKCEKCGEIVPFEHIDKAFTDGEASVVLTEDDLATLPAERSKEIDVLEFVPNDQVDPIMFGSAYYLAPSSTSSKPYVLLRRTLEETDRTAIVSFTLRQKTRLAALRVRGDALLLQTLLWADEIREPEFEGLDEAKISAKELDMSAKLVRSYEADFDPAAHTDDYQVQLRALLEEKLASGEVVQASSAEEEDSGGEVLDLMEALRRSVEASRSARGGGSGTTKQKSSQGKSRKKSKTQDKAADKTA
ncbi:MAG TPA: Ku protein [Candidatus Ruania gallistercoris]|uniref:Non-homologous end joining protein Ku n=1 Tax=Candidatus Ruania gallistercoris TaxID=2838746 RepID=A0A9D2EC61_9MICO|nr:Ku protein [Candidatus Ruania gallistercoris]